MPSSFTDCTLSTAVNFHASLPKAIDGASSLALFHPLVSQTPQQLQPSERHITCAVCFALRAVCSVISLDLSVSRTVHLRTYRGLVNEGNIVRSQSGVIYIPVFTLAARHFSKTKLLPEMECYCISRSSVHINEIFEVSGEATCDTLWPEFSRFSSVGNVAPKGAMTEFAASSDFKCFVVS